MNQNRIAKFSKVSFEQYLEDFVRLFPETDVSSQGILNKIKEEYDAIQLPKRATAQSAGYDFYSPIDFSLSPKTYDVIVSPRLGYGWTDELNHGWQITIPTGIRCQMDESYVLACFIRSSLGFKYKLGLGNGTGIIDADYFFSKNEGHIMINLVNHGDKKVNISAGDRIMQGIFLPYGITMDDDVTEQRTGGIGSTNK